MPDGNADVKPSNRRLLDNRIPPPVLALAAAILMSLVSRLTPSLGTPIYFRFGIAGALSVIAGVVGASAFARFGQAGTTINPVDIEAAAALVTSGVYRRTRNPMYVALTALLTALAFALSSAVAFAGPVLFALFINFFQIIPEERVMLLKFGDAYSAYKARVRRWL